MFWQFNNLSNNNCTKCQMELKFKGVLSFEQYPFKIYMLEITSQYKFNSR